MNANGNEGTYSIVTNQNSNFKSTIRIARSEFVVIN